MIGASAPAVSDESGRTTLRVRNLRESVVYHLMFDGDVRRLTGTQLKEHVASVCGIPAAQQILTFNHFQVTSETSGFDLGLHDGCTLLLDTVSRGPRRSQSSLASGSMTQNPNNGAEQSLGRQPSIVNTNNNNRSMTSQAPPPQQAVPLPPRSKFEDELEAVRRDERQGYRAPSAHLNSSEHLNSHHPISYDVDLRRRYASQPGSALSTAAGGGVAPYDDVDVDVEIEEEHGVPLWAPSNSVDLEESRLLQQDYTWRMEQVRFETERMNREREMLRQKQELDYQSELLERERIELERRTHTERLKLQMLQRTVQDEMLIEAKMSGIAEESVYRVR